MAYIPLRHKPLAWIDVETTGIDPHRHEIIDVAVVLDGDVPGLPRVEGASYFSSLISPARIQDADPTALKVNGYAAESARWEGAPAFAELVPTLERLLADAVCVGHNVGFDVEFIQAALVRAGSRMRLGYQKVDTITLVYEHLVPAGIERLSLDSVREFLGWKKEGGHRALRDALDARRLHKLLVGQTTARSRADWVQIAGG